MKISARIINNQLRIQSAWSFKNTRTVPAFLSSFAEWIGGFFTTEQVDEGLRMASESGLTQRIDQEVMDQGITFKVEDVLADTSQGSRYLIKL